MEALDESWAQAVEPAAEVDSSPILSVKALPVTTSGACHWRLYSVRVADVDCTRVYWLALGEIGGETVTTEAGA